MNIASRSSVNFNPVSADSIHTILDCMDTIDSASNSLLLLFFVRKNQYL